MVFILTFPSLVHDETPEGRKLIMQMRLDGLGLSLITRSPRVGPHELLYLQLQTIALEYVLFKHTLCLDLHLTLT